MSIKDTEEVASSLCSCGLRHEAQQTEGIKRGRVCPGYLVCLCTSGHFRDHKSQGSVQVSRLFVVMTAAAAAAAAAASGVRRNTAWGSVVTRSGRLPACLSLDLVNVLSTQIPTVQPECQGRTWGLV